MDKGGYEKHKNCCSTAFQDSGDATRAIEMAKAIEKYCLAEINVEIIFISHGSHFEENVRRLGFSIYNANPKLSSIGSYQDLGMTPTNLIGSEKLANALLLGELDAYRDIKPDIVLHGFGQLLV